MVHRSSHGKELPQRPPSLKNASDLSNDFEYAAIWTGQSNSLPWGLPVDAYGFSLELTPQLPGIDLLAIVIPNNPDRAIGMVEVIFADLGSLQSQWNTSTHLRFGTQTAPEVGYAEVLLHRLGGALDVRWITLPVDNNTGPGYLVRENGKWYSYENSRVLTTYMPWRDIRQPIAGDFPVVWGTTSHSPYPVPNGPVGADGRRLILPAPNLVPPLVTTFDDLAVFLPITRREGATGYGISEIADSTFAGVGSPVGHPLTLIAGEVFSFENAIVAGADLTRAYLLVDWAAAGSGGASKRSWAKIASNTTTTFTTDSTSWLGDLIPDTPTVLPTVAFSNATNVVTSTAHGLLEGDFATFTGTIEPAVNAAVVVTFNDTTDVVNWTTHGFLEGTPVYFQLSGGTLPPELTDDVVYYVRNPNVSDFQVSLTETGVIITFSGVGTPTVNGFEVAVMFGRVYRVRNPNANDFQLSESLDHPVITFITDGTVSNGYRAWVYTVWIPHWKDNPFMWLPGPEFAYPNEDSQPRNTFIHFRARGQINYAYNNSAEGAAGPLVPFDGISDSRFGAMLPFASRVGGAIGKVLNIVSLGIGSTPLVMANVNNTAAGIFPATIGWWSYEKIAFALQLEDVDSMLSKRVKRLITFIAPQALLAEGSTKLIRYLAACHIQGEADGGLEAGRETYPALITDYKEWLRELVDDMGANPFTGGAKMPFAQPEITHVPYEVGVLDWSDYEGYINNAIRETNTADEFAHYALTDDLPKINGGHFSGGGMVVLGARLASHILDSLEYALSYGSPALETVNPRLLRIANMALLQLGQGTRQITSLTDSTTESQLVATMWPEAVKQLLSTRQWSWAMRDEPAAQVRHENPNWLYAYVVPGRAVTPIRITPAVEKGTTSSLLVSVPPPARDQHLHDASLVTRPLDAFEIGRSPSGHRLLFTNVPLVEATNLDTQIPIPSNELFPERLVQSPTIYYVDKVFDPDRFSDSFATALTWLLASMLAPPLVKGQEGEVVATRCLQKSSGFVRVESAHETVTQQDRIEHVPTWVGMR